MKPHLIGIAGPSCSGKGELAAWLQGPLDASILDLDDYYRDQPHVPPEVRRLMNYDVPDALDCELLFDHLKRVAGGEPIERPRYDFTLHTRAGGTVTFVPGPYVIVDGLFALYWPEIRDLMSTRIFIDAPDEECLRRRIARDTLLRGRQEQDVIRQFEQQVRPAAIQHVRPTARFADLKLDGCVAWEKNGPLVLERLLTTDRG